MKLNTAFFTVEHKGRSFELEWFPKTGAIEVRYLSPAKRKKIGHFDKAHWGAPNQTHAFSIVRQIVATEANAAKRKGGE